MIKDNKNNFLKIFDIPILSISTDLLIQDLIKKIRLKEKNLLAFANVNTLNIAYQNKEYKKILNDFIVVNDGIGVDIASKILYKKKFLENLNGTDFTPVLFSKLPIATKIFFLGSTKKNIKIVEKKFIKEYPNLDLVGVNHGYFNNDYTIIQNLNNVSPDIVIIGFGNPKQEYWIKENYQKINATLFIGVGAFFDFYSGEIERAPLWIRKLRLEWIFRLYLEPKRLWKRYIIGNFIFILRILKQKYFKKA